MRGVSRNQPKVSILVQRDQDRQDGRTRSSTSPPQHHDHRLLQSKTTLVMIGCTYCLPSNLAVVGSLPANIWEEHKATINRT